MAKTFIQLINDVGKNLRRSTGSTYTAVDQDSDVIFVAQAINIAKDMVEAESKWDSMIEMVTFDTVVSTQAYDTSDLAVVTSDPIVTNERSMLLTSAGGLDQAWDVTDTEIRMVRRSRDWVIDMNVVYDGSSGSRQRYFSAHKSADGIVFTFPYTMSGIRNIQFQAYNPQSELTVTTDELLCPWRPVVMAATAIASEERGEELGMQASTWWERYQSTLSEAMISNMWSGDESLIVPV